MFLAILRIPAIEDAHARAASATGLAAVDVKRRLTGVLPRVLLVAADAATVEAAAARLEKDGFVAVAFEPRSVPSDDDRLVPRALAMRPEGLEVVCGVGAETRQLVPWKGIELIQRGVRTVTQSSKVTEVARKVDVGRTLMAGGIPIIRKEEKTQVVTREKDEPFALLHRRDGGDDVILYERRLDYSFLGAARDATSRVNLDRAVAEIAGRAGAPVEDLLARPSYLAGIPASHSDAVDVGAHLFHLAWRMSR